MAHYAIVDENNIVTQVIVGKDENEPLPEGYVSWEHYYGGLRTSYNTQGGVHKEGGTPFRKNFASIGGAYDDRWDAFYSPKPYPSWVLNYETFLWEPPTPRPAKIEGHWTKWLEHNKEWVQVPF